MGIQRIHSKHVCAFNSICPSCFIYLLLHLPFGCHCFWLFAFLAIAILNSECGFLVGSLPVSAVYISTMYILLMLSAATTSVRRQTRSLSVCVDASHFLIGVI